MCNEQSPTPASSAPPLGLRMQDKLRSRVQELEAQYAILKRQEKAITDKLRLQGLRTQAREDLYYFATNVCGFRDLYEPLHRPLCDLMQNRGIRRRLILEPRGHFKTTICSIAYPLWRLANDENSRVALCSRAAEKSYENMEEIIARAHYPRLQLLFGDAIGHPRDWPTCRKDKIRIPRRGSTTGPSIAAYSTESSEVGRHCDEMIIDDMADQSNINTQQARDQLWTWFGRQLSVLDPGSYLTVIGTRWHWDDPYSRIQKQFPTYGDSAELGWFMVKRKAIENGKIIFPTRFTREMLEEYRRAQGDYIYSCFYDNEPVGEGMNPFDLQKLKWINYERPQRGAWTYILVDPASTREDYSSYTGVIIGDAVTSRGEQKFVVRKAILKKLHPDAVVDLIFDLVLEHSPYAVIIEDEGFQKSLYYWCRREMLTRGVSFTITMVSNPRNVTQPLRLLALQPYVNGGVVMFDENMDGKAELVEEFETYPKGPHKDLICALYFVTRVFFPPEFKSDRLSTPPPVRSRLLMEMVHRRERYGRMPNIRFGGSYGSA